MTNPDGRLDQLTLQMMRSIVKEHAEGKGDHGSGYCCQLVTSYTRKIAAHEGFEKTRKVAEAKGEPVFRPASDRQAHYIRSLARKTPMHLLAPDTRTKVERVQAQNEISMEDAKVVIDELLSVQRVSIPTDTEARATRLITSAQLGFLKKLLAERQHGHELDLANLADLPLSRAKELITDLKEAPFKGQSKASIAADVKVTEGVYQVGDDVYKVKKAIHGSGSLYASQWNRDDEKWTYRGQRVFALLTDETKMTAEQAKVWGKLYGRCVRCNLPLTDEVSQAHGYGKKCAQHEGWPYDLKIKLNHG